MLRDPASRKLSIKLERKIPFPAPPIVYATSIARMVDYLRSNCGGNGLVIVMEVLLSMMPSCDENMNGSLKMIYRMSGVFSYEIKYGVTKYI